MIHIVSAESGEPLQHFISLAQEYVTWMMAEVRQQYPDLNLTAFVGERTYHDLSKKFPGKHVPPDGCLLVALIDGQPCGCIALARLTDTICEMRTLYVRSEGRGLGVAKSLVDAVMGQARSLGYDTMRLDTLRFMVSAQTLYRSRGFTDIEPYRPISDDMRQYVCFFECRIRESSELKVPSSE